MSASFRHQVWSELAVRENDGLAVFLWSKATGRPRRARPSNCRMVYGQTPPGASGLIGQPAVGSRTRWRPHIPASVNGLRRSP
jgi:hypothetical protein